MKCTLFDTHAHLTDPRFDKDRDALIQSLPARGVERVVDVACDTDELPGVLELIRRYHFIYAAAGLHPHNAGKASMEKLDALRQAFKENEKLVAVGEIGLDYHYDFAPRHVQREWFARQLELAKELNKPVVLHIREAFGDAMDMLHAHKEGLFGVMHCYSGSLETAFICLDMGLYIAFGGAVTFENARKLSDVASRVPLDRIVLETDCPYLAPMPHRGKRNDPSLMIHTAKRLSQLKGVSLEEVCETTYLNASRLFRLV